MGEQPGPAAAGFELRSRAVGALPIVAAFADRLGLVGLLTRWLGATDARVRLAPAAAIWAVIANLCVSRTPLYGLGEWAAGLDPGVLGLGVADLGYLNDDRVGRALDRLFESDRASLLCELVLAAVRQFGVDTAQLHNDSTSISVHGQYAAADGREHAGKRTVALTHGHSKDHRPDLKQLVVILTVSADGAVPVAHRVCDGNTADSATHIESWDGLRALVGRPDFLYVADCKLATREQMDHINANGGRFVSVVPRSRTETARLCEWMTGHTPAWTEAARRPAPRRGGRDDIWSVVPAPIRSTEGYRIVWVHSTAKAERDHAARHDQLARGLAALHTLNQRLASPKCRLYTTAAVHHAATQALRREAITKLVTVEISHHHKTWTRIESRGRGKKPGPRHCSKDCFSLTWTVNHTALARETAAYGCFALISNDTTLTDTQLLAAYRYQPNLEKRHHQLKTVLHAAPIQLKSPARIEALLTCQFIALLLRALIERQLRTAITTTATPPLALYPEHRACPAPTAARILDTFTHLARHHLHKDHHLIHIFQPELTPLQQHILQLLDLPHAYTT